MFSQRLKAVRELRQHSQASLAELLNVAPQQIYRLETGKHVPSSETVIMLAQMLDVSTDYLLGMSDEMSGRNLPSDLSAEERQVLEAIRRGDRLGAIKAIIDDEVNVRG